MTRLLLFALIASSAFAQAPVKTVVVEGRVTSASTGAPLRRAMVTLQGVPDFGGSAEFDPAALDPQKLVAMMAQTKSYKAETDAEGKFSLPAIEAGQYTLIVTRTGYVRSIESLDLKKAEDRKDFVAKLMPQSVIAGKVLDEFGDPFPQAAVTIFRREYSDGQWHYTQAGVGRTGADGAYSIGELEAGRYYVSASDGNSAGANIVAGFLGTGAPKGPTTEYVQTFYPSGGAFGRAAPVTLTLGSEARGIDIRVEKSPVFQVRGKVVASNGSPVNAMLLMARNGEESAAVSDFMRGMAMVGADGTFRFSGVVPGTYTVRLEPKMGAVFGATFAAMSTAMAGANAPPAAKAPEVPLVGQQVVVVVDRDVDDVSLLASTAGDITGRWRVEESKAPKSSERIVGERQGGPSITLMGRDAMGGMSKAMVNKDGTFSVRGVAPGAYRVSIGAPTFAAYVRSMRFEGQEAPDKVIHVGLSGGQLEIVFANDGGTVTGVVRNDKGDPVKVEKVVMWDAKGRTGEAVPYYEERDVYREGQEFRFDSVPPGEYRIAAWAEGAVSLKDASNLGSPEFLAQFSGLAVVVKVAPDSEQVIDVKVVGKEAIEKALAKLP